MNIQNVKLIGILVLQAGLLSHAFSASVSDPVLSVAGLSTSQQTVAVTISDTTSGATICYTTDGSNPSQSSATITSGGTILIPQNATLNVQAFLSGTSTSNMVTAQYGINAIVSAGDAHTLALRNDGTVWAWGDNSCGELGNGTIINSGTAVQVMINSGTALSGVVAIAAGSYESFAVDGNGNVWAWGLNTNGELAIGTTTNAVFATQIPPCRAQAA